MSGIKDKGESIMFLKRTTHGLIYSCLIITLFLLFPMQPVLAEDSGENVQNEANRKKDPGNYVLVTYFHTTARCPTCRKIEMYSKESIENFFPKELQEKKVVFQSLNIDEAENQPFIKKYNLFTKSLIVSFNKDSKEAQWKNLTEIWKLVRNRNKFEEYVQREVTAYLEIM